MSEPTWYDRLLDAWAQGEHAVNAAKAHATQAMRDAAESNNSDDDTEPFRLHEFGVFVAFLLIVATTFYAAWHATSAIGRTLQLIRDTLYFFVRLLIAILLVSAAFFYIAPPEVRKESMELCAAVAAALSQANWSHHVHRMYNVVRTVSNGMVYDDKVAAADE